jgi:glycosyltransferase involved in cell wall biosynthesis
VPARLQLSVWEITPYGLDDVSGITTFVVDLSRRLCDFGYLTTIVTPKARPRQSQDSVRVRVVNVRGPFRNIALACKTAGLIWENRRQWDILHLHQAHPMTLLAALVARLLDKPAVATFHVLPPAPTGFRRISQAIASYMVPRLAKHRIFVSARTMMEFRLPGIVIRNGIDFRELEEALGSREGLRSVLGLSGFVVVFAGRKAKIKGFGDLLAAVRLVRQVGIDLRLLAVGSVPPREAGEFARIIEGFGLGPFVLDLGERPDHLAYLAAGDAFALPSYREGMPLALLEAMAAGLPIVASNVGGIPELVADGQDGILVPPGDVAALSRALQHLAENRVLASQMGASAKRAARSFDASKVAGLYRDVFEMASISESLLLPVRSRSRWPS